MKHFRFFLLSLFVIAGILLSSCTGGSLATSYPGLSGGKDTVYLADNLYVMAVKASDGSMAWKYPSEKGDPTRPTFAPPAVTDSLVITGDYCKAGPIFNATPTCTLEGLDTLNGTQKWAYTQGKGKYIASPLVVGDLILAPSADGNLYGLNQNGAQRWIFKTNNSIWAQPAADGTNVYVASMDKNLYAIRISDGTQVWAKDLGAAAVSGPTLSADGVLYLGTMANDMLAVDAATGNILQKYTTKGIVWSAPLLINGVLYFGDNQSATAGSVYALDAKTFAPKGVIDMSGPVIAGGVQIKDGLVFVTETGDVQAFSLDAKKVWTHNIAKGKLATTPVVVGDRLIIAITLGDSALVALDFNGNQVWSFVLPK
jgi:outer membrane protein assembly factor BamB